MRPVASTYHPGSPNLPPASRALSASLEGGTERAPGNRMDVRKEGWKDGWKGARKGHRGTPAASLDRFRLLAQGVLILEGFRCNMGCQNDGTAAAKKIKRTRRESGCPPARAHSWKRQKSFSRSAAQKTKNSSGLGSSDGVAFAKR